MPATKPKLLRFSVTVRAADGHSTVWGLNATDLETAAKKACKRIVLDSRGVTAKRTSGSEGEPGWFVPYREWARFPFAGNAFYVEQETP